MKALAYWSLCLSILIFPLGQLGRVPLGPGSFYLYELFLSIPLLYFSWVIVKECRVVRKKTDLAKHLPLAFYTSILVFLGSLSLSLGISLFFYFPEENVVAILYALRLSVYTVFLALLMSPKIRSLLTGKGIPVCFGIAVASILAGSAIQYMYYPDLRNLWYAGWDPHYFRLFGTFLEPVMLAAVFGISLIVLMTLEKISPFLRWGIFALGMLMLFFTFSRAALIAFMVVLLVYSIRNRLWWILLGGAGLLVIGFIVAPKPSGEGVNLFRTSTIESRMEDYRDGIRVWQQQPIHGIGYNHIPYEKDVQYSYTKEGTPVQNNASGAYHSSFLTLLATGGVVTLIAYVWFLIQWSKTSSFHFYAVLFLSVLALFDNVLLHPFVLFWTGIGGVVSLLSQPVRLRS